VTAFYIISNTHCRRVSKNCHSVACRCMLYMLFMLPLSCHSVQNIFTRNPDKGIYSLETLPLSQYLLSACFLVHWGGTGVSCIEFSNGTKRSTGVFSICFPQDLSYLGMYRCQNGSSTVENVEKVQISPSRLHEYFSKFSASFLFLANGHVSAGSITAVKCPQVQLRQQEEYLSFFFYICLQILGYSRKYSCKVCRVQR
jgi:hypothetical protein